METSRSHLAFSPERLPGSRIEIPAFSFFLAGISKSHAEYPVTLHRVYQQFIDSLSESRDIGEFRECLRATADALELSCFAYLSIRSDAAPHLISTYPPEWIDRYLKHKYEELDPVIAEAASNTEPFQWGLDLKDRPLSVAQQRLFEEAATFGISCGFTVPIHDRSGAIAAVTFAAEDRRASTFLHKIEHHREILQLLAMCFHSHVRKKFAFRRIGTVSLSPRELECLKWAARGKSAWEIGRILGISKHTAATYLENARTKLGVRTTVQAVARLAALDRILD